MKLYILKLVHLLVLSMKLVVIVQVWTLLRNVCRSEGKSFPWIRYVIRKYVGGYNAETLKTAHTIVLVPLSVRKEYNIVSEIYLVCYGWDVSMLRPHLPVITVTGWAPDVWVPRRTVGWEKRLFSEYKPIQLFSTRLISLSYSCWECFATMIIFYKIYYFLAA